MENQIFQYGKYPILSINYLTYSISYILNIPLKRHKINYLKTNGRNTKKAPLLKGLSTFVWLELEELYISNHKNTKFSWKSQIEQHSIE